MRKLIPGADDPWASVLKVCACALGAGLLAWMILSPVSQGKCGKNWELTLVEVRAVGDSAALRRASRTVETGESGGSFEDERDAWPSSLEFSGDSPGGLAILGEGVSLHLASTSTTRSRADVSFAP